MDEDELIITIEDNPDLSTKLLFNENIRLRKSLKVLQDAFEELREEHTKIKAENAVYKVKLNINKGIDVMKAGVALLIGIATNWSGTPVTATLGIVVLLIASAFYLLLTIITVL